MILLGSWLLLETLNFQRVPSINVAKTKTETVRTIGKVQLRKGRAGPLQVPPLLFSVFQVSKKTLSGLSPGRGQLHDMRQGRHDYFNGQRIGGGVCALAEPVGEFAQQNLSVACRIGGSQCAVSRVGWVNG